MNRRVFLRRAAGASLALPLLQLPGRARAAGDEVPRRLVIFFTPNGTKKELWSPAQQYGHVGETGFELGSVIQPLTPFRDRLVLLDGVDMKVAAEGPGGPHQRGMASLLTGSEITAGDFVGGDGRRAGWGGSASIDQAVARALQPDTRLTTMELGVRVKETMPRARINYAGPEQPLPPQNDPVLAFERAFGQMDADPAAMRRRMIRRRSVLDAVLSDFGDLKRRVSRVDAEKLERHATALRDLERRLELVADRPNLCHGTPPAAVADPIAEAVYPDILDAQMDIAVNALACDVTRIATIQCSTAVNALRFGFLGQDTHEGHGLSHSGDTSDMQQDWVQVLTWYADRFAELLRRMDAVPEGDGTLLDNSLVLWVNELSRGNTHSHEDMPFVLAGGAGGALRGGRFLQFDGVPHNDMLVSVANLMGVPMETFGDPRFCNGPLVGL